MTAKQQRKTRATKRGATRSRNGKRTLSIEYVPLTELEQWPRNPKLHDLEGIQRSMRRWGFTLPVIVDEGTGRLVAGHGRQEALSLMKAAGEQAPKNVPTTPKGEWLVPVVTGNHFDSEEEAEKYLIADNRFVELGGWDPEMLTEMLRDFDGPELSAVGFDEAELARITQAAQGDEAPEKFVSFTAKNVETKHECPKCGFKFND